MYACINSANIKSIFKWETIWLPDCYTFPTEFDPHVQLFSILSCYFSYNQQIIKHIDFTFKIYTIGSKFYLEMSCIRDNISKLLLHFHHFLSSQLILNKFVYLISHFQQAV